MNTALCQVLEEIHYTYEKYPTNMQLYETIVCYLTQVSFYDYNNCASLRAGSKFQ